MSGPYIAGRYNNPETGRYQWAVFHLHARTWYFPRRRGQAAARALAARMNRGAA